MITLVLGDAYIDWIASLIGWNIPHAIVYLMEEIWCEGQAENRMLLLVQVLNQSMHLLRSFV